MTMSEFYLSIFIILCGVSAEQLTLCTTPNGETGSCVPLLRCPVLIQSAVSNEPDALKFFNESLCDEKSSIVCCGTSANYTKLQTIVKPLSNKEWFQSLSKEEKKSYVLERLLPSKLVCGMQHTDDYFYNATETSVDEFPWLVYIIEQYPQYDTDFYLRIETNCVGVLISKQYVLSTVACLNYAELSYADKIQMLLGVHHVHKKVNCIGTPFGVDDCTDPSIRLFSSQWKIYEDVALFRLDIKVDFSDFIRPICLPLQSGDIPTAGSLVMASGWGEKTLVEGKRLKLKKRMKYTTMNTKDCESYNPIKNSICGLPYENNTHYFCKEDIGGPLMYRIPQKNWFAVGLAFQTTSNACDEFQPITAMRLTPEIVNWIVETIEP